MSSSLFNNFVSSLVNKINGSDKPLELEVKLKNINFYAFQRVKTFLTQAYGSPSKETYSEDLITQDQVRQSVYSKPNGTFEYITINKKRIENYDSSVIDLRLSLSSEEEIKTDTTRIQNVKITRVKHRYTWKDESRYCIYDLTEVTETQTGRESEQRYEIELELLLPEIMDKKVYNRLSDLTSRKLFETAIGKLAFMSVTLTSRIQNSDKTYSMNSRNEVVNFIKQGLKIDKFDKVGEIPRYIVAQARNIKFRDLVYGGLLSKPQGIEYSVTVKAEGKRKLLLIHETGIWLLFPKGDKKQRFNAPIETEYCQIADKSEIPEMWKSYYNTIFDGEDIEPNERYNGNDSTHYYLPFDTLMFAGRDVRKESLKQRLSYRKAIISLGALYLKNRFALYCEEKPFFFFNGANKSSESFYKAIKDIEYIRSNVNYKNDGFIFTPNSEYNYKSFGKIQKVKSLVDFPEICKWKPWSELTIDLAYKIAGTKRYLASNEEGRLVKFEGNKFDIFDSETQVDWLHSEFAKIPVNTIIEFEPYLNIDKKIMLRPKKARSDKNLPNGIRTAMDVWEDINNPITLETMKGESTDLMFKYHNQIKRKILKGLDDDCHIIDIGSGKGGDLTKMSKAAKALLIEPYVPNLNELKKRLSQEDYTFQSRFDTLNCGGEATELIIAATKKSFGDELGTKPLYITMMLSLSFFWSDSDMLQGLVNTINSIKELYSERGGKSLKFVYLTIEGERTLNLMKKYNNLFKTPGDDPYWIMQYKPETHKIFINIKDSIVVNQTEYLVNLKELSVLTNSKTVYEKDTNEEIFLNSYEKEITSMYVYGVEDLLTDNQKEYIPEKSTSTLFDCLFKAIYPKEKYEFVDILKYREELTNKIDEINKYVPNKTIFESAGNGILSKLSKTSTEAKKWIFSNNELSPEYIGWIPDTIGYNLIINDLSLHVSELNEQFDKYIKLNYDGIQYSLIY